jgi:hypothetical protein
MSNKIAVFYNLWPETSLWETVFDEQMSKLCSSGLYEAADFIHIGVNAEIITLPYELKKFRINYNKNCGDEFDTLMSLYNFCNLEPDYKIFYFHLKGMKYIREEINSSSLKTYFNVNSWRNYLEYFNILKWENNLKLLDDTNNIINN